MVRRERAAERVDLFVLGRLDSATEESRHRDGDRAARQLRARVRSKRLAHVRSGQQATYLYRIAANAQRNAGWSAECGRSTPPCGRMAAARSLSPVPLS